MSFTHLYHKNFTGKRPRTPQRHPLRKALTLGGSIELKTYPRPQKLNRQGDRSLLGQIPARP